jgi:sulfur carrier protein
VKIIVNGVDSEAGAAPTVASLMEQRGQDPSAGGIAIAINGEVVPRAEWGRRKLDEGDRVEILAAIGGG